MLGVPEAPPEGHLRALGAPVEDRAPGSGEGLGKERAPKADVTCFPFFTLCYIESLRAASNAFPNPTNVGEEGMELTLCPLYSSDLLQAKKILYADIKLSEAG